MKSAPEQRGSGAWRDLKGRVQEAWGVLTDDEMDRYEGKKEQFIGFLEKKTGQTRDLISRKLDEISNGVKYGWAPRKSGPREF